MTTAAEREIPIAPQGPLFRRAAPKKRRVFVREHVRAVRASFEIPNPKHEIRNKSKTRSKNVQNEDTLSRPWCCRCLADLFLRVVDEDARPGTHAVR